MTAYATPGISKSLDTDDQQTPSGSPIDQYEDEDIVISPLIKTTYLPPSACSSSPASSLVPSRKQKRRVQFHFAADDDEYVPEGQESTIPTGDTSKKKIRTVTFME